MAFARNTVAYFYVFYARPYFSHNAYVFMAYGHRSLYCFLAPFVPFVDMEVGTADGGLLYLDKNIVYAYFRYGHLFHPDAFLRLFLY